jgi:chromosome segregation ATPase
MSMSRQLRSVTVCIVLALILANGCQREISGVYVAQFPDGVWRVQLVRIPDNRLSGEMETAVLKADGKIVLNSVPVSGAINGANVTMSASMLGFQVVTLSGTLDGNELTLTGSQSEPVVLRKSDISGFQTEIKTLNIKSEKLIANKAALARALQAQQNFSSEITRILRQIPDFNAKADLYLSKFPAVEERLHAITAKMAELVDREKQLAGRSNSEVTRSQLADGVNEGSITAGQLHNDIQSLRASLDTNVQPLSVEIPNLRETCHHVPAITRGQSEGDSAACEQMSRLDGPFREKLDALTRGLDRLERICTEEQRAQHALLETAQRLR